MTLPSMMSTASNLKHAGLVIGGCNFAGFAISAALETHKITDLVGVGSFVAAAVSLTLRNPTLYTPVAITSSAKAGLLAGFFRVGKFHVSLNSARVLISNGLVILWGVRLSTYLFTRVLKLNEDKRLNKVHPFQQDTSYIKSTEKVLTPFTIAIPR